MTEVTTPYYRGFSNGACHVQPFDVVMIDLDRYIVISVRIRYSLDGSLDVRYIMISERDADNVTPDDVTLILDEEISDTVVTSRLRREVLRRKASQVSVLTDWDPVSFMSEAQVYDKRLAMDRLPPTAVPQNLLLDDVDIETLVTAGSQFTGIPFASPALYPKAGLFYPMLKENRMVLLNIGSDNDEPIPIAMVLKNRVEDRIKGIVLGDRVEAHPISENGIRDTADLVQLDVINKDGFRHIRGTGTRITAEAASADVSRDVDGIAVGTVEIEGTQIQLGDSAVLGAARVTDPVHVQSADSAVLNTFLLALAGDATNPVIAAAANVYQIALVAGTPQGKIFSGSAKTDIE
jgi:hypothetical protein